MNSQFGLANVWFQGDIVTKSVAVLLLLMSLASWMAGTPTQVARYGEHCDGGL